MGNGAIVLFIILAIILIIQIILKLSNHSPTDTQILYIALGAILSYLLVMSYKIGAFVGKMGAFVGEVREFMNTTKNSFAKLKK